MTGFRASRALVIASCLTIAASVAAQFGLPRDSIRVLAFSHSGKTILAGSEDGAVRVWNADTGARIAAFNIGGAVHWAGFTADDSSIVTARGDALGVIRTDLRLSIWDARSGAKLRSLGGESFSVYSAALSPTSPVAAASLTSDFVQLFDVRTGSELRRMRVEQELLALAFDQSGTLIAGADEDGTIRIWRAETGELVASLSGPKSPIRSVAFLDRTNVVGSSDNGAITIWDVATKKIVRTFRPGSGFVPHVAAAGSLLASVHVISVPYVSGGITLDQDRNVVGLWTRDGAKVRTFKNVSVNLLSAAVSPGGTLVATGAENGAVELWNPRSGMLVRRLAGNATASPDPTASAAPVGAPSADATPTSASASASGADSILAVRTDRGISKPHAISFSSDGRWLAAASSSDLAVWDLVAGTRVRFWPGVTYRAFAWSPDGSAIAIGGFQSVSLRTVTGTSADVTLKGHAGLIDAIAFSSDGRWLATGGSDRLIHIWSLADRTTTATLKVPEPPRQLAFATDHQTLIASGERETVIWDLATKQERAKLLPGRDVVVRFDGAVVASALGLFDARTQRRIARLGDTGSPLAFDPAGRFLATRDGVNGRIAIWNTERVVRTAVLPGHTSMTMAAAFRPGSNMLASADATDGSVKIWDLETRREIVALVSINEDDWIAAAPDGRFEAPDGALASLELTPSGGAATVAALRTPGLLTNALAGKIATAPTGARLATAVRAPSIRFATRPASPVPAGSATSLTVEVIPNGHAVDAVVLLHNGGVVARHRLTDATRRGADPFSREFQIRAIAGSNQLRAIAIAEVADAIAEVTIDGTANTVEAPRPQLVPQTGHVWDVERLAFSRDGSLIATGSGTIVVLWDAITGRQLRSIAVTSDGNNISAFAFDPSGDRLAVAGQSQRQLTIWDVTTASRVRSLDVVEDVVSVEFTAAALVAGSANGAVLMWDSASFRPLLDMTAHKGSVRAVAASQNGDSIVTAAGDGTAKLWTRSLEHLARTFAHGAEIDAAAISADGRRIATRGRDRRVVVWDARSGATERVFTTASNPSLVFSPDGSRLAAAGNGGLHVWDVEKGGEVWGQADAANGIAFSPDGATFAGGGRTNREIVLRDAASGAPLRSLASTAKQLGFVKFGPGENQVATAGDGFRLWDLSTARLLDRAPLLMGAAPEVSDDWRTLVRSRDRGAAILSADGDEQRAISLPACGSSVLAMGLCPISLSGDGSTLASAGADFTIEIRALANGRLQQTLNVGEPEPSKPSGTGGLPTPVNFRLPPRFELSGDAALLATTSTIVASFHDVFLWRVATKERAGVLHTSTSVASMEFSPDAALLAVGGFDGAIELWRTADSTLVRRLAGHADRVASLAFNRAGTVLATASADGSVRLWRVADGEEISALVPVGDTDYVVAIPDGRYTSSRGAYRGVAFRVGRSALPFEQFDAVLNRPDVVLQRIGVAAPELVEAYRAAHATRVRRMNLTDSELVDPGSLPVVTLLDSPPASTTAKTFRFRVRAWSGARKLGATHVFVNNVPAPNAVPVPTSVTSPADQTITIELSNGSNKIQVSVSDDRGVESLMKTFYVTYAGTPTPSNVYLLTVGVSNYAEAKWNLQYAAKDARDLANLLGRRVPAARVLTLTDAAATRDAVLAARSFLADARVDDEVIVFIAGHGVLDRSLNYYFAPHDHDFSDPAARGLTFGAMEDLLVGVAARRKLLLMDTCHAGEVDPADSGSRVAPSRPDARLVTGPVRGLDTGLGRRIGGRNTAALLEQMFSDLRRGTGATVISAAGGLEFAYEGVAGGRNGVFTHAIVEAMDEATGEADRNRDGVIQVSELRDYVVRRVTEITGGKQTPTARRENLEFDFAVLPRRR